MTHSKTTPPDLEPLAVPPKKAAELLGVCLATVHTYLELNLIESTLVRGRRLVNYASLKKLVTPDKARKIRRGVHNRNTTQTAA